MARRKTRKKKPTKKQITITAKKLGALFVAIWALYFFVIVSAPDSIFAYFTYSLNMLFGRIGTHILFALFMIIWVVIFMDPMKIQRRLFPKIFFLLFVATGVLSLPIMEEQSSHVTWLWSGWYLGDILVTLTHFLMWDANSTKIIVIVMFLAALAWLLYTIDAKNMVPKMNIDVGPVPKKKDMKKPIKKPLLPINNIPTEAVSDTEIKKNFFKSLIKGKMEKKISEKKEMKKSVVINFPKDKPTFDTNIMDKIPTNIKTINEGILIEKARKIQEKLAEFNIPVEVSGYDIWPTVIQFKIKPDSGIKVSSIERLKKDLALSMKSKSLRILAPIPGTNVVGIEIPNPNAEIVYLKEILRSKEMKTNMNKQFTNLCIGKWIDGSIFLQPLEKMPHLLVAGATGSGKSVAINDFILSLMYQNSPNELKFIMIDPKQVELGLYEWLPYLLAPIINEPEKALRALKWAVEEMKSRYKLLKVSKVRNIEEYNARVSDKEKMNRIVIIIDELADLMMSGKKKDVELYISRIAQMARAVGMHLIVATQRPSVNVITGLIKANIPTRIAFGVVSQIDSRTILDRMWAEDLLGKWDLLFSSPTNKYPVRVQAPFVSTEDTEKVIKSIQKKYMQGLSEEDIYDPKLIEALEQSAATTGPGVWAWNGDELLLRQAMEVIQETRKASITLLQRRLKVGFARAARLMDQLEERWVVWPQEGSKAREIRI